MLKFLNGRDLVKASYVSKVWLSASRLPALWEGLDMSRLNLDKRLNMTSLLKVLGRPQFAGLKHLALPYKVKLGKNSMKQIAKLLPHIETFDVGYYDANVKAKDCDLMALTEHFTNLNSVRTDMWNVTNHGIMSVARAMGEQLLDLRIKGDTITDITCRGLHLRPSQRRVATWSTLHTGSTLPPNSTSHILMGLLATVSLPLSRGVVA